MRGFPAHTIPSFLLFVFGAEKDDDEVGLVVIKLCEIDVKVRSREFGGVPAVIEDLLTCDVLSGEGWRWIRRGCDARRGRRAQHGSGVGRVRA